MHSQYVKLAFKVWFHSFDRDVSHPKRVPSSFTLSKRKLSTKQLFCQLTAHQRASSNESIPGFHTSYLVWPELKLLPLKSSAWSLRSSSAPYTSSFQCDWSPPWQDVKSIILKLTILGWDGTPEKNPRQSILHEHVILITEVFKMIHSRENEVTGEFSSDQAMVHWHWLCLQFRVW